MTTLIFASLSTSIRVMAYVLYFTPCLGLFNVLRHYQGEMYPFDQPYGQIVDVSQDRFYFGDAPPIPWSDITRWNYTGFKEAEPPQLTLYTYFTIEEYFFIFIGTLLFNIMLQLISMRLTNPEAFQKLSCLDKLIHAITSSFIPHPMEDWDEGNGTIAMHKTRKRAVWKEMFSSMVINFLVNAALLAPLIHLGNL